MREATQLMQVVALLATVMMVSGSVAWSIKQKLKGIRYLIPFVLWGCHYLIFALYLYLPDGSILVFSRARDLTVFWLNVLWLQGVLTLALTALSITRRKE